MTVVTRLSILGYFTVDSMLAGGTTNTTRYARLGNYFLSLLRKASTITAPVTLPTHVRTRLPRKRVERAQTCAYSLFAIAELAPRKVRPNTTHSNDENDLRIWSFRIWLRTAPNRRPFLFRRTCQNGETFSSRRDTCPQFHENIHENCFA
jgi:hypothetical protein